MTRQTLGLSHAGLAVASILAALAPAHMAAQPAPLAARIVPTDPSTYRPLTAVHAGAGSMAFAGLLGRGAIGPHFNFLHRGEIPARSGIGHHFHNTVEEMFVILNGEAQFTINGRTAGLAGPAAVVCRMGDSHAILNTGAETLQWMNFQASSIAGVGDAFDLGDDRTSAVVDPVPTFIHSRLDRSLIRPAGTRAAGGAAAPPVPTGVTSRRLFAPTVFRSAWAYVDHLLIAPGASTPENAHESLGEAYYVLAGSGTVKVGPETAPLRRWNAIPVTVGERSSFTNTGSEPLELLVVAVARDMEAKTALVRSTARP
jgi:mannose-6-phosphate isomerase-like protein (cupin superfamily)